MRTVPAVILLIEDEKNIAELVKYNLERESFRVLTAFRGDAGLDLAFKGKPALIILDLMLPEVSGLDICKIIRQNPKTMHIPILMLTAKGEESDKVIGLELGADDYVTKPFSPKELVARVKAILRRGRPKAQAESLRAGGLLIDTGKHLVTLRGKNLDLTSKEYDLLKALVAGEGRVLTRDFLLSEVWGYARSENIETRTIDMHIGQLRKKLKTEGQRIVTVKNVGYRFEMEGD